jgi:hypothetical protein
MPYVVRFTGSTGQKIVRVATAAGALSRATKLASKPGICGVVIINPQGEAFEVDRRGVVVSCPPKPHAAS